MEPLQAPPSFRVERAGGGERTLVDLALPDLRRYERVVARLTPRVERFLDLGVLANRVGLSGPRPFAPARRRWVETLAGLTGPEGAAVVLVTDVRRCYASIGSGAVEAGLRRVGVGVDDRAAVQAFLRATTGAGIDGLPVGPDPSAILANAVLAIGDDAVRHEGARLVRWVDDVVIAGDAATVRRAYAAWLVALHDLGLREREEKRRRLLAGSGEHDDEASSFALLSRYEQALGREVFAS